MNAPPSLFDRASVHRHIMRARANFAQHSALFDDSAEQIEDRLSDIKRNFSQALDLSPFPFLTKKCAEVTAKSDSEFENEVLPFAPESFDLIASNLSLHWINNLPLFLMQIRAALKPDGFFIASVIGENSLHELRSSLIDAELALTGGISPRLSPTIALQSAAGLLQNADFKLPMADIETVTLIYNDMFALMRDLRGMGQTNAHVERLKHPSRRAIFFEAARLYQEKFGDEAGQIPATFDIIYLHGWK